LPAGLIAVRERRLIRDQREAALDGRAVDGDRLI
jgi:hypothetical protein